MMINKTGSGSEVAILLLVGSHSVSLALLSGKPMAAILDALTICMCVLIFMGTLWLSSKVKTHEKPSLKSRARKRQTKG